MRQLQRLALYITFFLIFIPGILAGEAMPETPHNPLVVRGDNNFPPFEYQDENNQPTGFNVELLKAVAAEIGLDVAVSLGPWDEVRHQLEKGEIDIITGMFYSEEREKQVEFSIPHILVSHSAFVRTDSPIHTPDDLRGKRIIVQKGDIMHDYLIEKKLTDSIHTVEHPESALALLSSGEYDAALLSRLQGLYLIEKNGFKNLRALNPPLFTSKYCFTVKKGNSDLLAKINEGLFILKTKGIYQRLHQKWFGIYEERDLWDSLKYYILGLTLATLLLAAALLWSYILRKQVADRTRDLVRKIEEHRKTADVLKETEARFQLAVRASSVGLWNWDDIRKDRVWWSPQVYELLGYREGEIEPSFSQLIHLTHPDDREKAKRAIASHLKYRTPYNFEYRLRKKKGNYGWFRALGQAQWDEDGTAVRMAGSIQDITALKRSEADRIQLATAVEQTMEGIIIAEDNGLISYINPAFLKMTGDEVNELLGRDFLRLKSETDLHPEADAIRKLLFEGNTWKGLLLYHRDNGKIQVETTISPIRDVSGRIMNFVAVYRDVTREIELETRLRQSQKMEAIGTLAGGIAHDFNNILYALIGYTELAMAAIPPESRPHGHLKEVLGAAWRARDLVRQILTFSRNQTTNEFYPIHIKLVVKEVLNLIRATIPASIEIRQIIESERLVKADPTQIHQVLMNLCTNSAHAMAEGGGILIIRITDIDVDEEILKIHPDLSPGKQIQISVSDTGTGIPPEIVDRIFDPFFTTKSLDKGSGLGLAVVHGIVKSHSGAILVKSQPGGGTTFDVYLPALDADTPSVPVFEAPITGGKERILFVDDEPAIADMAWQVLQSLGYKVTVRTDPGEALELFSATPGIYDLVITDMTMPHLTGEQLASEILDIRPDVPIILCSGIDETLPRDPELMMGIRMFLLKPIVRSDLARKIRKVLDENTIIQARKIGG